MVAFLGARHHSSAWSERTPDKREVDGGAPRACGVLAMLNDAQNPSGPISVTCFQTNTWDNIADRLLRYPLLELDSGKLLGRLADAFQEW